MRQSATLVAGAPHARPSVLEFAVCVAGIYGCFLTWGVTQERVSTTLYGGRRFRFFVFLNLCQALIAAGVGFAYMRLLKRGQPLGPLTRPLLGSYARLSLLGSVAPQFGYAALRHIDYPTVILGKSCKLIPVMLMNFLIYRRTFPAQKYLVVLLITVGVSSFMLQQPRDPAERSKGPASSSLLGVALLSINMLIDGATNSTQDRIFSKFRVSGTSMMVWMNVISFCMMCVFLLLAPHTNTAFDATYAATASLRALVSFDAILATPAAAPILEVAAILNPHTTELWDAIAFCRQNPSVFYDILLFGFAGAVGQCFIFHTLERFGAIVLVTVTVTRKMFSIILSVFGFNHHVTPGQWASVGIVFIGIIWESFGKSGKSTTPGKASEKTPEKAKSAETSHTKEVENTHEEEEVHFSTTPDMDKGNRFGHAKSKLAGTPASRRGLRRD